MGSLATRKNITFKINGKACSLAVGANETLAEVLRERLGLKGTKVGCNQGECGACTVLINGRAILSCLILAVQCEGEDILTIEGIGDSETGQLSPIQEAFVENFGIQCGFCTPGMIMSVEALLSKDIDPNVVEVETGTQAAITAAILRGAHIVRVHDVANTRATVKVIDAMREAGNC